MIRAPSLPTAEQQHALGSLLTRRLVLVTAACLAMALAVLLLFGAYRAVGRTADRMDPIVAPIR